MLNTVLFVLDEASRGDEEIAGMVRRTMEYIEDCGYRARLAKELSDVGSSFDEKYTTLVVCDDREAVDALLNEGWYTVGLRHEKNPEETFDRARYVFGDIEEIDMDSYVKAYQRYAGEPWELMRTERLLIRETTVEDVDEFYRLYADPTMTQFMEGLFDNPEDEKRYQRDYIEKVYGLMGFGVWTLELLSDGTVIGRAGYSVRNGFDEVELGFLVGKDYQRQGYATEACRAILDYGRDVLGFDRVQTLVKAGNAVSIHMCERLGFERADEVDVEENIYGNEYKEGKKVALSHATYGNYVRMIRVF